jgi:vacuolar-type H+-ATPase subunit I/STV1
MPIESIPTYRRKKKKKTLNQKKLQESRHILQDSKAKKLTKKAKLISRAVAKKTMSSTFTSTSTQDTSTEG